MNKISETNPETIAKVTVEIKYIWLVRLSSANVDEISVFEVVVEKNKDVEVLFEVNLDVVLVVKNVKSVVELPWQSDKTVANPMPVLILQSNVGFSLISINLNCL